jgi:hypothetical protein
MSDLTDNSLRAEVEELRAANAALKRRVNWRRRFRRSSVVLLLVLGCGLAALSVIAIWLRVTLLDTDRYVKTVTPIAAQPAVQKAVADKLNAAIDSKVDFNGLIQQALPDRADVLAPALANGLQSAIKSRIDDFTASPKFQELWVNANRTGHDRIVALLTGGRSKRLLLQNDTVYLDLSPAVDQVKAGLRSRGLGRLADAIPASVNGQIPLVQSDAITKAQGGIRLLKAIAIALPIIAFLCLLGSVLLTRPWRRGLLHAALGVVVAMLLLIAALAVARSVYLDALSKGALPGDAAGDIFDTMAAFLRHGVRIVAIAAVAVAAVAFIAGLPLKRLAVASWNAFATDSRTTWVAKRRRPLMITVGSVGALVLLVWSPLTGTVVLIDLLIVAALIAAIAGAASQAADPVADQLHADHEHEHGHDHGVVGGHP